MGKLSGLLGKFGVYAASNILNAAVPFLLLPLLTRFLTTEDYGRATMFAMALSLFSSLTGLSVHGVLTVRFFKLEAEQFRRYVGTCVAIGLVSTFVIALLTGLLGIWLSDLVHLPPSWLVLAVLVSGGQFFSTIRLTLWQVRGNAVSYGTFMVVQSLLNGGISVALVTVLHMDWQGRALGQAIAVGVMALLALSLVVRKEAAWPRGKENLRDALKFGIPLIPHSVGAVVWSLMDRVLIANILDVGQVGIYMVALQIGLAFGLLTDSFNRVYSPWLMSRLTDLNAEMAVRVVRGAYVIAAMMLTAAGLVAVLAPLVLPLIVGPEFVAAAPLVGYIALGFAFGGMYFLVANYLFFANRTGRLSIVTVSMGVVNGAATFVLLKLNGLVGAAQAFALSQILQFFCVWLVAHHVHPMPWWPFGRATANAAGVDRREK